MAVLLLGNCARQVVSDAHSATMKTASEPSSQGSRNGSLVRILGRQSAGSPACPWLRVMTSSVITRDVAQVIRKHGELEYAIGRAKSLREDIKTDFANLAEGYMPESAGRRMPEAER